MHQPITHLYRERQHLWYGSIWLGMIVATCAPGTYLVADRYGACCITNETRIEKHGVNISDQYPDY